jgi:hypothetical protein
MKKILTLIKECKYQEALDVMLEEIKNHSSKIMRLQSLLHICAQGMGGENKWGYYDLRPGVQRRKFIFTRASGAQEYNQELWSNSKKPKTLLVLADEGLGDELHYTTYIDQLNDISADHIYMECDERLTPLFQRTYGNNRITFFPRGTDSVAQQNNIAKRMNKCNFFILMGDLIHKINPGFKGKPIPLKINRELTPIEKTKGSKTIGISYISMKPKMFKKDFWMTIFKKFPDYTFLNLQENSCTTKVKNNYLNKQIVEIASVDLYADIDSLASIINSCDMIITISNTIAHLTGRLHKKAILITPMDCNSRWIMTDVANYYPEMKHIRGEADYVQERVAEELGRL